MKRRHLTLWLGLALSLGLSACGIGQRQNPVASDGELGSTQPVQVEEDKPSTYTTRGGDTLAAIAGRPEIYGDPALWPLLQGANPDSVAGKGSAEALGAGLVLQVPRNADPDALAQAREQDRQVQAAAKARLKPKSRLKGLPPPPAPAEKPVARAPKVKPAATHAVAKAASARPQAKPTAVAVAPAPAAAPSPVAPPVAKGRSAGMRPLLLLLLLVLLALGAVLWAFARRDRDDAA